MHVYLEYYYEVDPGEQQPPASIFNQQRHQHRVQVEQQPPASIFNQQRHQHRVLVDGQFQQMLAIFGPFLGQIELFPKLIGFFFGGRFSVRTVTSDCLADKFGGRLEISTILHHGWLRGSNRRPLLQAGFRRRPFPM